MTLDLKVPQNWGLKALRTYQKRGRTALKDFTGNLCVSRWTSINDVVGGCEAKP